MIIINTFFNFSVVFDGMTLAFRKQLQLIERKEVVSDKKYDGRWDMLHIYISVFTP